MKEIKNLKGKHVAFKFLYKQNLDEEGIEKISDMWFRITQWGKCTPYWHAKFGEVAVLETKADYDLINEIMTTYQVREMDRMEKANED